MKKFPLKKLSQKKITACLLAFALSNDRRFMGSKTDIEIMAMFKSLFPPVLPEKKNEKE